VSLPPWNPTEALPEGTAWLLEASAGTGKTYQIAGLVLRLVAEYGLSIERILAITFTNAATAELRDRIRQRLSGALVAMERGTADDGDAFVAHLLTLQRPGREELIARLRIALRHFDLAAISTIHGFAQRMLTELAFESGQDPDLELLADPTGILEEIVDDELARFFHRAGTEEVALYQSAGYTRDGLMRVARVMSGAVEPEVVPSRNGDAQAATRADADAFLGVLRPLRAAFESAAGATAFARLVDMSPQFNYGNRLENQIIRVRVWLRDGAVLPVGDDATGNAIDALQPAALRAAFEAKLPKGGDADAVTREPFWPLLQALSTVVEKAPAFWNGFAPLADFAVTVRPRFEAELRRRRVITFDAMLSRLAAKVAAEGGAASAVAQRIRDRYDAALVDEFQDTDASQWAVLEAAFLGHKRLILIGDPKQSIYAFRGADVQVYTTAAAQVAHANRRTMNVNYRSDPAVLDALNTLWRADSRAFDDLGFDYVEVRPPEDKTPVAGAAPSDPGLELRWVDGRIAGDADGALIGQKRPNDLARLAAAEAVASLSPSATGAPPRVEQASGLAVLVNSHAQATAVSRALRDADVPAVAATRTTVFATEAAEWLATWLDAVAAGGRDRDARAAVVTPLFGWTADDLAWGIALADRGEAARDEEQASGRAVPAERDAQPWQSWTTRLHVAAARWPKWGFARVLDREMLELGVLPRVLAMPGGERHATDLRHLFELVHAEERATRKGPAALADWIRAEAKVADQERSQRLESDAQAVRIETIHASKGLQYGHVLLPFPSDARAPANRKQKGPIVLRSGGRTRVDLSPVGSDARQTAIVAAHEELRREELRKLYVALTRAEHRNVAWYGPIGRNGESASATAMGRLLFRDPKTTGHVDVALPMFDTSGNAWSAARQRLDSLTTASRGATVWSPVAAIPKGVTWRPPRTAPPAAPQAASWPAGRPSLRGEWRVTSYSGLAARSAVAPVDGVEGNATTEGELERDTLRAGRDERPSVAATAPAPELRDCAMPRGDRDRLKGGGGTVYGTFVHEVFEAVDFTTVRGHDGGGLRTLIETCAARNGLTGSPRIVDDLTEKLPNLLLTPLDRQGGTLADPLRGLPAGFTLAQIHARDRLDELEFSLRLGAGTRYATDRPLVIDPAGVRRALESALDDTRAAPEEIAPVRAWLTYHLERSRLEGAQLFDEITGILTGSIDLVFRAVPQASQAAEGGSDPRWFVVDYKTNVIETSAPGHFTGPWLAWKMATTGYPLQALLYTLALHRHLRLRLGPRYDYDRQVGGYLYLFLRGMAGPDTPRCEETGRCLGVFAHRWSRQTIERLDAALGADEIGADAPGSGR
jgi:exodeoxyribonuclease V beta subunit